MNKGLSSVVVLLGLAAASCATYTGFEYYPGAPRFTPTSPGRVELLRHAPRRPHLRLGEVWIKPEPTWSPEFVETTLREQGAKLGAQALVIVVDRFTRNATVVPYYWRRAVVYRERVIVGVAIRYGEGRGDS